MTTYFCHKICPYFIKNRQNLREFDNAGHPCVRVRAHVCMREPYILYNNKKHVTVLNISVADRFALHISVSDFSQTAF